MDVKTLVKANIRYKKGSFISVLVLTFIITLCLTTIISINHNIERLIPNLNYSFIDYKVKDSHKTKEIIELIKQNHGDDIEVIDYSNDSFDDILISALWIIKIAIYKAIGFSTKSLRIQFSLRFAIVALLGCGIGSLANLCFNDSLMSALLSNVGLTSYESSLSTITYVFPTVILTTCFFVFSYLLYM